MGGVYLGMSPAGRAVAVKIVHPELAGDAEFIGRFRSEVAAAQAVNGIYTAQVVAAGLFEVPPWLATAYIPGLTLQQLVDESGPLPTSHSRSPSGARSVSSRSVIAHPCRSGAAVRGRTRTDPADVCRSALSTDSQKRRGSRSSCGTCTNALARAGRRPRLQGTERGTEGLQVVTQLADGRPGDLVL